MIKTKVKYDILPISDKDEKLCKLVFDDIRIVQDFNNKKTTIHFVEYIVLDENVEFQREIIVGGNPVLDEEGKPTYETVIEDRLQRKESKSKTVSFDIYNTIATQVKTNLPSDILETDEDKIIAEQGVKLYIIQEGLYKGKLKTLNDFE